MRTIKTYKNELSLIAGLDLKIISIKLPITLIHPAGIHWFEEQINIILCSMILKPMR